MVNFSTGTNFGDGVAPIEHWQTNDNGEWILSRCTQANIPSGVAGYAVGGILETSDTGKLYSNIGSATSCLFVLQTITQNLAGVAINSSATATPAQILSGLITSTSAAATNITTPTATAIAALIPGTKQGTSVCFYVDNSAGANTVTIVLDGSITAPVGAITGGNNLAVTTTNKVGYFELYFTSLTTAVIFRAF
jgi:hypothetical protein